MISFRFVWKIISSKNDNGYSWYFYENNKIYRYTKQNDVIDLLPNEEPNSYKRSSH